MNGELPNPDVDLEINTKDPWALEMGERQKNNPRKDEYRIVDSVFVHCDKLMPDGSLCKTAIADFRRDFDLGKFFLHKDSESPLVKLSPEKREEHRKAMREALRRQQEERNGDDMRNSVFYRGMPPTENWRTTWQCVRCGRVYRVDQNKLGRQARQLAEGLEKIPFKQWRYGDCLWIDDFLGIPDYRGYIHATFGALHIIN
jgi:hypothetical protein